MKDTDINIMRTVEEVVSRYFPTVQLSSPSRRANYVQARQYFAWICTKLNVPETYIAEYLNRNHASIYRMNMNTQNYICLYTTFRKNIINIYKDYIKMTQKYVYRKVFITFPDLYHTLENIKAPRPQEQLIIYIDNIYKIKDLELLLKSNETIKLILKSTYRKPATIATLKEYKLLTIDLRAKHFDNHLIDNTYQDIISEAIDMLMFVLPILYKYQTVLMLNEQEYKLI
ncbi:MAG TPA: hypothetical protein P5545_05180 [Bacteroidota bacterium]|nr:hypothetical protein [Candidatus Kapabacteria bacterium]HRS01924.1 hypothetical protein [Bacteroidota bacterium]